MYLKGSTLHVHTCRRIRIRVHVHYIYMHECMHVRLIFRCVNVVDERIETTMQKVDQINSFNQSKNSLHAHAASTRSCSTAIFRDRLTYTLFTVAIYTYTLNMYM